MKLLATFITLIAFAATLTVIAADATTTFAPSKVIPDGVYDISRTIIIPRQRKLSRESNKAETGVPAPYMAKQVSQPGGWLRGENQFGTVLRFAPTVKGALIQTEDYGTSRPGAYWNDGNTQSDTNLRANLSAMASDFTVDGRAEIRPYPWSRPEWAAKPDLNGPDCPQRANGLSVQGSGFRGERLRFFQIPGTAILLKPGRGKHGGTFGIYDNLSNELNDIWVSQAINGIVVEAADTKLRAIYMTGIVRDGLTISGPGSVVDGDHVYGADRSVVITQEAEFHAAYHEAARIGTHIISTATGTRIDGLNIGPGTCWERGVKLEAHGCTIKGLHGTVLAESAEPPDIAGVEIAPGLVHEAVDGALSINGDGSEGLILRGHRNKVELKGGWNKPTKATFIRVAEAITATTIEVRGSGNEGTVLDLSKTGRDTVDGLGNEFKIRWSGTAERVIYPGGGAKYNLAPGTQLWIDGKLQSADRPNPPK